MLSVKVLITIPTRKQFDACTLVFDSIRVGFPTAKIHVDINDSTPIDLIEKVEELAQKAECFTRRLPNTHHGSWIANKVEGHIFNWPMVILDGDTIFWKSVEDWVFPPETLLAGYYVPEMWNDFAKCISMPRIHTSLMWFPNVPALREELKRRYPYAHEKAGEYCPCDPFMPAVKFFRGQPYFWDSCANLYGMLSSARPLTYAFEEQHKECFDHLNSASFYDVMMERLDNNRGFHFAHNNMVKHPGLLQNLWPVVDGYYKQKAIEGQLRAPSL